MKTVKTLFPLFLVLVMVLGTGCSYQEKKEAETAVKDELDLLKNLDLDTAQKYVSQESLFPGLGKDTEESQQEITKVFSLFFQDFNYKILDVHLDKDKAFASATLRLATIDGETLAKDFAASCLKQEILQLADDERWDEKKGLSLKERYIILNHLLESKDYKTAEKKCTVGLKKNGKGEEASWEILRTYALENSLVGNLMASLSDPDILSATDTLTIYLETLKEMNKAQMCSLLGAESLSDGQDTAKNAIASALAQQVHDNFDYEILECKENGYQAQITVQISTFDSEAILKEYQTTLDAYLSSPQAVIDGASVRLSNSYNLLLECIQSNHTIRTSQTELLLTNDGDSWKLDTESGALGSAIFGPLSTTPPSQLQD